MKQFKKILFTFVIAVVGSLLLIACKDKKVDLEAAKEKLAIVYTDNEVATAVTKDVTLPTTVEGYKNVTVTWESDKPTVIGTDGKVTRQAANTEVKLTATLKAGSQAPVTKPFTLTVIGTTIPTRNVTFTVTVPEETYQVFIIGSINDWDMENAPALTKGSDGKFSITISLADGEYEYKYVNDRDWEYVEKDAEGGEIANRKITTSSANASIADTVVTWAKLWKPVDKNELKGLLDVHYADSLAIPNFLVETESVELVSKAGEHDVTWTTNNDAVINPETGIVTRPAYTGVGEVFVVLTAKAEGQNNVNYIVKVEELEQTLDQKLEEELKRLTNFPSSYWPILKVADLELSNLVDVNVDGEKVTEATWTSSDTELMSDLGLRTEAEFEGDKDITFTVTFEHEGITKTKEVVFTIRGVRLYAGFLEMLEGSDKAAKGDMVKITDGVSFYANTNDGYYLIDKDGVLLFVYGSSGKPAANKLFYPKFELDLYYASPQAKGISYVEVEGGVAHTEASITEITLDELVKKATPTDDAPLVHRLYKVTGAKLHTFNLTDNYMTYLVPQSHDDPTKQPNKSDSMMLYYQTPGGVARLQEFAPLSQSYSIDFDHIVIVVSAFRTNNDIYAFMFLGDVDNEADVKLGTATDKQAAEQALMQAAGQVESQLFVDGAGYTLTANASFQDKEFAITYVSDKPAIVNHDGTIVAFPAAGTIEDITFTLTTTANDEEVTLEHTVKLGRPATIKIDEAVASAVGTVVAFEGYLYGGANNTWQFVNPDSQKGGAVRYFNPDLVVGTWYLVIAERASDYNGLAQLNHIGFVELESTDPFVPVNYTGELTSAELLKIQNSVVSIDALEVSVAPSKASNGVLTYTLKNGAGQTIAFREHQSKTDYIDAVMALDLKVGDFVNVKSAVVSWFNNPQFLLGVLEVAEVEGQDLFDQSVLRLEAALPEGKVYEDVQLPITFEELTIVWTVTEGAAAASVDATGKVTVTQLEAETPVKLTGAVTQGDFAGSVEVILAVAALDDVPPTGSLLTTIDFGAAAVTGYGTADQVSQVSFTNGDGIEYTLNKMYAQINTSNFAPHNDDIFLVMATRNNNKTSWVEFDLNAVTNLSKISVDFSVWNQNNFDTIVGMDNARLSLEKKVGDSWVAVEDATAKTNVLSSLVKDAYTTITFENLTAGLYRVIYDNPNASASGNTTTTITADNVKIYG